MTLLEWSHHTSLIARVLARKIFVQPENFLHDAKTPVNQWFLRCRDSIHRNESETKMKIFSPRRTRCARHRDEIFRKRFFLQGSIERVREIGFKIENERIGGQVIRVDDAAAARS